VSARASRLWQWEAWGMTFRSRRRFHTGTKSWTSSRDSSDGKTVVIEVSTDSGTKTMSVRKEPLELIPAVGVLE
jgi:hypothetical protein